MTTLDYSITPRPRRFRVPKRLWIPLLVVGLLAWGSFVEIGHTRTEVDATTD